MYLLSDPPKDYPNSISSNFPGYPINLINLIGNVDVSITNSFVDSPQGLAISTLVISTNMHSGRSFYLFLREKSQCCIALGVISHSERRLY
jgi:hypothetical protein